MFQFVYDLNENQIMDLMNLFKQSWWGKERTLEEVKFMLKNSDLLIGITNQENQLIGFSRVITDYIYKAVILDVIVDERKRKQGLGRVLFETIMCHPKIKDVKHIELYCKDEMIDFYKKFGFTDTFDNLYFMRKNN